MTKVLSKTDSQFQQLRQNPYPFIYKNEEKRFSSELSDIFFIRMKILKLWDTQEIQNILQELDGWIQQSLIKINHFNEEIFPQGHFF